MTKVQDRDVSMVKKIYQIAAKLWVSHAPRTSMATIRPTMPNQQLMGSADEHLNGFNKLEPGD